MLAISAGRRLALIDQTALRSTFAPPSPSKQTALDVQITAIAWANPHDATSPLYAATGSTIRQYDSTGHFEKLLYTGLAQGDNVKALAVGNRDEVVFAKEDRVFVLNCVTGEAEERHVVQDETISAIALSKDAMLLAVATCDRCTVLDLSESESHSISLNIGGLAASSTNAGISAVAFHPHGSSRLLLTRGRFLFVYDVSLFGSNSDSTDPIKQVSLGSSANVKDTIAIACSPFSKSLVAVACKNGALCLVDLDKEKGLIKVLETKSSLSAISFSADGTDILLGTESGHLLVMDLRNLDKVPKKIAITSDGKRVAGIAVQARTSPTKKSGSSEVVRMKAKQLSPKVQKPLASQDLNVRKEGLSSRVSSISIAGAVSEDHSQSIASPPATKLPRTTYTARNIPGTPAKGRKVSAAKTAIGTPLPKVSSSKAGTPGRAGKRTASTTGQENAMTRADRRSAVDSSQDKVTSLSSLASKRKVEMKSTTVSSKSSMPRGTISGLSPMVTVRSRKMSIAKSSTAPHLSSTVKRGNSTKDALNAAQQIRVRATSSASATSSVTAAKAARRFLPTEERSCSAASTRTPSPDFDCGLPSPTMNLPPLPFPQAAMDEVVSGVRSRGKANSRASNEEPMEALEDDFDAVIESGRSSRVFRRMEDDEAGVDDIAEISTREESMQIELSPRRPFVPPIATGSASSSAIQLSPLRGLQHTPRRSPRTDGLNFGMDPPGRVEEFLRSIMKDALYDFHQETRNELLGLHLDVLKMGRGLKKEIRDVLEEYVKEGNGEENGIAEMKRLREENRSLKEEVARLRGGL